MVSIPIYAASETDFSHNGLGLLLPTECTVEEMMGGIYELTLIHPISGDMRWAQLQNGNIIKAPVPTRESPLYEYDEDVFEDVPTAVTRNIYRVDTPSKQRLRLRQGPSLSAVILDSYVVGTEVAELGTSGDWKKVTICKGGVTGYMWADYLTFVRTQTDTITTSSPVGSRAVRIQPARNQLFRIYSVEADTQKYQVTVKAMHISYDLRGNIINGEYAPENVPVATAARLMFEQLSNEHPFTLHADKISGNVTGEYSYRSIINALLDPDDGIAVQANAIVARDNFDVFLLPDTVRDTGVTVRRGKNLIGLTVTNDMSGVVTRIIPVGKDKNGDPLYISGTRYVDSEHISDYPTILTQRIEYDVTSGSDEFPTDSAARTELENLAKLEFTQNGIDLPTYGLEVDFVLLSDNSEFPNYASLQAVHLYDTVTVIDELIGLIVKVRVTAYKWDVLAQQYEGVTLGQIHDMQQTVYSYNLPTGGISGTKIAPGTLTGSALRDTTIGYAKIQYAAIEQLAANSITAVRAHINELVAGSVTTDQLYADLATLAKAQITAANIESANIDWASIKELSAQIAEIAKAEIAVAEIDVAQITNLSAQIAEIVDAKIENVTITSAQISDLQAIVASIADARIGLADIDYAKIKDLVAGTAIITEGVGGKLYVARLAVTEANMVSLTVGELMLKATDGSFVRLIADGSGGVTTEIVEVENSNIADGTIQGDKLIENTITARELNVEAIFADTALIQAIKAGNIDVADLFAADATIGELDNYLLRTTTIEALEGKLDVWASEKIDLEVSNVRIGGRNLLLDSGAEQASSGYLVATYTPSSPLAEGEVYTVSICVTPTSDVTEISLFLSSGYKIQGSIPVKGAEKQVVSLTFVASYYEGYTPENDLKHADILFYRVPKDDTVTDVTTIHWAKVEKGNKATDWTPAPEDPASGLVASSNIQILKDLIRLVSTRMEFAVPSEDGETDVMRLDENGITAEVATINTINSPSVLPTFASTSYTPINGGELEAILGNLSGHYLLGDIVIDASAVTGGIIEVRGLCGYGRLILSGGTINQCTVENCSVPIQFSRVAFSTSGTAFISNNSTVLFEECVINALTGLSLTGTARLLMRNCAGTCNTLANVVGGSFLHITGETIPYGVLTPSPIEGEVYSVLKIGPAPDTEPEPETPTFQTIKRTSTNTRTWGGSWLSGNALYQGRTGTNTLRRGCMWFDLSDILGKNILSATLTLKRYAGVGEGGSVDVGIYGTTNTGPSGTPVIGTKYATVALANGATKSVDVTEAVKALAVGAINGLMMYDNRTGTFTDKTYTYGYSKYYGSDTDDAPVLTITYQ